MTLPPLYPHKTDAMRRLQNLVSRGHARWTGGQIEPRKLPALCLKFADRYGVERSAQQRWRAKATIAARIFRLANGLAGDVSPVGDGVSELRIHYGPGYRIYFQQRGNELVILLCGGDKGSQSRDIKKAKQLASEWRQDP